MKTLFAIFLSFFVLSVSTSFAGTFFEPPKPKPKEKAKIAAAKLSESFSYFYKMLMDIEMGEIEVAKSNKEKFLKYLGESSKLFENVVSTVTDYQINFLPQTGEQIKALRFLNEEYFKGKPITEKDLASLAVKLTGDLLISFEKFQITPDQPDFFSNLRKLIFQALKVQWTGIDVSDLWEGSITSK